MMKFFITLFLILSTKCLLAQADCVISFNYKAIISGDLTKVEKVGLPKTRFLKGYVKKDNRLAFYISKINGDSINDTLGSHMSSEFCRSKEDIIENFFKASKEYLIKIFIKQKGNPKEYITREIRIPVNKIKFSINKGNNREIIIVDVGEIKI